VLKSVSGGTWGEGVVSEEEKETDGLWIRELYISVITKCIFYVPLYIWCHLLILRGNILFNCKEYTVTYRPIGRQRLDKHIPVGAKAHKNRKYVARQRMCKQAFSTRESLCFCVVDAEQ
jgi:hypothetical protein